MSRFRFRRIFSRRKPSVMAKNRARQPLQTQLRNMLRKARLHGDLAATIAIGGVCTPAIRTKRGSLWVLPLTRQQRQQYRSALAGGKRMPAPRRKARPDSLLAGIRGNGHRFLFSRRAPSKR